MTTIDGFIPRPSTVFQVKAEDITPSGVTLEMRPAGVARTIFPKLADLGGAYIIASSKASTSDSALAARRTAMRNAVADVPNSLNIVLDFYDRARIASWVRTHAAVALWVRERIGKGLIGWQTYGAWTSDPRGVDGVYLSDKTIRVEAPANLHESRTDVSSAVGCIRAILAQPKGIVRLVGLSGVGKTRFAQALFDSRLGTGALDPARAVYTNIGDDPNPQPLAMLSQLIAARASAVLVVDNCPPELHRRLSDLARVPESTLALLTIEYDIRDDQPEATNVFKLEPASLSLLEELLKRRFGSLSAVNASTIAQFASGNAKVAIALASTVQQYESIAQFSDRELFTRLFEQRQGTNESLLSAAQACALVYSFDGDSVGATSELALLGSLVGMSSLEVFKEVAELKRRDLVQQRGIWRAVLPHAIANRLAAMALENIPPLTVSQAFANSEERLLRSFSRRLGYLHESSAALTIVKAWLGPGGLLAEVAHLNHLGNELYRNIAPVAPEMALGALETATESLSVDDAAQLVRRHVHLIRSLAFDEHLFHRSMRLLKIAAIRKDSSDIREQANEAFCSMFHVFLSGTMATIEQRLAVVEGLLRSPSSDERKLGESALTAVLEAWHFSSFHGFDFGARSRSFGYWPSTRTEITHWYSSALRRCEALIEDPLAGEHIRNSIAGQFRGLWTKAAAHDDLERVCRRIAGLRFWPEGWIAVRVTQQYDGTSFAGDVRERLSELEKSLRPNSLIDKVRSIVLPKRSMAYMDIDLEDEVDDPHTRYQRLEELAEKLGGQAAEDDATLIQLGADLTSGDTGRLWAFGHGLAQATRTPKATWYRLASAMGEISPEKHNPQVFRGFIQGLTTRDNALAGELLDEALDDEVLGRFFPRIQSSVSLDERAAGRLMRSIKIGKAPIHEFRNLSIGRATDKVPADDLKNLLLQIAEIENGLDVAIEILYMRLHAEKDLPRNSLDASLIAVGQELLRKVPISRMDPRDDHEIGDIVRCCIIGEGGDTLIREICAKLRQSISEFKTTVFSHRDMIRAMLEENPRATMDALFANLSPDDHDEISFEFSELREFGRSMFDQVPEELLHQWCVVDAKRRFPLIARGISVVADNGSSGLSWTSKAEWLISAAPDKTTVLRQFVSHFFPMSWSGSRADIIERHIQLLDRLPCEVDEQVGEFAKNERARLVEYVRKERKVEAAEERTMNERFE